MGQSQCKMLYLPAQSGKTRKMEDLIAEEKEKNGPLGDCNFIISDNNILLTEQTNSRLTKDLATGDEAIIKNGIFSWTSSPGECKISDDLSVKCKISAGDLAHHIINGEVDTVVMCAHPTRFKYLNELIKWLSRSKVFSKKINIWIDEADKSIKLWSKYSHVTELIDVQMVTLISATLDSIIKKYGSIHVIPYEDTHPECYRCFKDSKRRIVDLTGDAVNDAQMVMEANGLLKPGKRGFVPMEVAKDTHDEFDLSLRKLGVATLVLNGDRKELYVPKIEGVRSKTYDITPYINDKEGEPVEISSFLAQFYKDKGLERVPFVVTGRLCLSRGVTFQSNPNDTHDGFVFDYEILPDIVSPAEAYQTAARGFGNVVRTKSLRIYSSETMLRKIEKQEDMAVNTAKLAMRFGYETIGKHELRRALTPCEVHFEPFASKRLMAQRWFDLTGNDLKMTSLSHADKDDPDDWCDISERLKQKLLKKEHVYKFALGKRSAVHTVDEILSHRYECGTHEWGSGFGKKKSGEYDRRVYVGYNEDGTETFFLRWAIKP
jgi:hypothetical protein